MTSFATADETAGSSPAPTSPSQNGPAPNGQAAQPGRTVESLRVELGERSYDIRVGSGLLGRAGTEITPLLGNKRVFVVTDETVAGLHLATLERALEEAGIAYEALVVPAGEQTKNLDQLGRLVERLLEARIERRDALVALGGGVIGDLAGFAAAVVLRGVDYIQIPTTLLAQVDSSVGGKTGINAPQGKNLIGAFHQPRLVLCDTELLATLPRRELLAGYAEVAKYGLIRDAGFFAWLEGHASALLDGAPELLRRAVLQSCADKAAVVAGDERETAGRALLNLGHTFGHSLEAECRYSGDLLHGEAVSIGMCLAADLSCEMGLIESAEVGRIRNHLAAVGLPTDLRHVAGRHWPIDRLIDHMSRDKKVRDGRVTFILLRRIGEAFTSRDVDMAEVRKVLTLSAEA